MHEALRSIPLGYIPINIETEHSQSYMPVIPEESEVQGHPPLHSKSEANLSYMRRFLKGNQCNLPFPQGLCVCVYVFVCVCLCILISVALKKHHDQSNSYKRKNLIKRLLIASEG